MSHSHSVPVAAAFHSSEGRSALSVHVLRPDEIFWALFSFFLSFFSPPTSSPATTTKNLTSILLKPVPLVDGLQETFQPHIATTILTEMFYPFSDPISPQGGQDQKMFTSQLLREVDELTRCVCTLSFSPHYHPKNTSPIFAELESTCNEIVPLMKQLTRSWIYFETGIGNEWFSFSSRYLGRLRVSLLDLSRPFRIPGSATWTKATCTEQNDTSLPCRLGMLRVVAAEFGETATYVGLQHSAGRYAELVSSLVRDMGILRRDIFKITSVVESLQKSGAFLATSFEELTRKKQEIRPEHRRQFRATMAPVALAYLDENFLGLLQKRWEASQRYFEDQVVSLFKFRETIKGFSDSAEYMFQGKLLDIRQGKVKVDAQEIKVDGTWVVRVPGHDIVAYQLPTVSQVLRVLEELIGQTRSVSEDFNWQWKTVRN